MNGIAFDTVLCDEKSPLGCEIGLLPRGIPSLTEEQWLFLEVAMKRGPTQRMKEALDRAKRVYASNPL